MRNSLALASGLLILLSNASSASADQQNLAAGHPRPSYSGYSDAQIDALAKAVRKSRPQMHRGGWEWDRLLSRYVDGGRKEKHAITILHAYFLSILDRNGREGKYDHLFPGRGSWGSGGRMRIYGELVRQNMLTSKQQATFKSIVDERLKLGFDYPNIERGVNNRPYGMNGGPAIAVRIFPDMPNAAKHRRWLDVLWRELTEYGDTFAVSGNNGVTVSIADAGGLSAGATYKLIDFTSAGADRVEADDFQLESAAPVKEAAFSVVNNVLQVKIDSLQASAAKEGKYRWHHKPGVELALRAGDKTIWAYHFKADGGFPYVHPLATSDGTCLTALAPEDHPWHRAVWFSWKYLNGINYWDWGGDRKQLVPPGRTVPVGKETVAMEADRAKIAMNLHYTSDGRTILKEQREIIIRVPRDDGSYTMDWRATFTAAETNVVLDRTPIPGQPGGVGYGGYAGLSFRGAASLRAIHSLDSEGRSDMQSHGKPARWLDYHAVIDKKGRTAGVTIFDHPNNLRHPSPWYLSFGGMPYFGPAPIFHKPYTLSAGRSFTLRYRILVHSGRGDRQLLEREYKEFASSE